MANVQHAAQAGADLHEPKGVAAATANDTLVADGIGSADWVNTTAFAEMALDLGSTLTRSFAGPTAYTDFILDYIAEHEVLFSYNDTTKELTFTGARDVAVQYSLSISIMRTDVGGSPELTLAMFEDIGAGFVEITSSRGAASFTGNDVSSISIIGIHTLQNGDKLKLQVKTDDAIDIELRNMNWSIHSIGVL